MPFHWLTCRVLDGVMNDVQQLSPWNSHPHKALTSVTSLPIMDTAPQRLLYIPRARAGSCTSHMTATRIFNIYYNYYFNLHTNYLAHSGSTHVPHLTPTHGWERRDVNSQPSVLDLHCPWRPSSSHRVCPPLHRWKENKSFQAPSRVPTEGLQRALIQAPKLTMDVLLLRHRKGDRLLPSNTSIILPNSPASHPSCTVIQFLPCINF